MYLESQSKNGEEIRQLFSGMGAGVYHFSNTAIVKCFSIKQIKSPRPSLRLPDSPFMLRLLYVNFQRYALR